MNIFFVGIHNKPGKAALDSSTKTGRIIDIIITQVQALHTRDKLTFHKTNLYNLDYLPIPGKIDGSMWALRVGYGNKPDDCAILLGKECVLRIKGFFSDGDVLCLGHPGHLPTREQEDQYITNSIDQIRKFLIP